MAGGGTGGPADSAQPAVRDARVAAVLSVLAGASVDDSAVQHGVDPALLARWVEAFVEAGAARVTNRPEPDAARLRDRYLAAFAHELRTPLTVVSGWAGLVPVSADDPGGTRALEELRKGLSRLNERLRDLELLGAAAMGRLTLDSRPVTLDEVLEGLDGPASAPVDGADEGLTWHVDPAYFRRIVRDLWDAAGTHPEPASRRLQVLRDGAWVQLAVVREGAAMSPQTLQAMLDPFDHDMDRTGVSIGLYLARALTVAHSGTLGVSQDERRTVFWVRTPVAPGCDTPSSTGGTR